MILCNTVETREYSMDQKYQIGEVIEHPFFGKGKVIANLKKGKIEVNFEKNWYPHLGFQPPRVTVSKRTEFLKTRVKSPGFLFQFQKR
jgi:hypothetical protein